MMRHKAPWRNFLIQTDTPMPRTYQLLAALLDHTDPPWPMGEVPPLGHWLLFTPDALQSDLGDDGHPQREDDGLPRRMWAGGRIRFFGPLPMGTMVTRETIVSSAVDKLGKSGPMRFVTLTHRLSIEGRLAIEEEQDLVYRRAALPGAGTTRPLPPDQAALMPHVSRMHCANPVDLFRFSALTFNAHRIHYDRAYATVTEGYPGLVVHGPYVATLLMDHYLRQHAGEPISSFQFRAQRPIFEGEPFTLGLNEKTSGAELTAIDAAGGVAMQARIER